ncbi:S8/S53 family peptidase [Vitiosangium sp. GDMCC 1.1324]|uniref:S8/S53 family peptidase n=1 Tax=Vitiosangium sp. (strain GDMCC 1.1324) TaxID=2138576 RepID=UPI00130ECAD6|nr:S8/S53 family peptidase [Vitiosangium sp. GDMCC 1.1324]
MSFRVQAYPRQHRGYHLLRQLDVALSADDLPYQDFSIVSPLPGADGRPLPVPASWVSFPSVGKERLYVSPSIDEGALPARFIQPLVCRRRGHPARGVGYIGVDSHVSMGERYAPQPTPNELLPPTTAEQPEIGLPRPRLAIDTLLRAIGLPSPNSPAVGWDGHPRAPVRVAVIDTDCGGWGVLRGLDESTVHQAPSEQGLRFPRGQQAPEPVQPMAGHGVVMAAAIEAVAMNVRLGLFEIPFAHASHVHGTDLAAALARAVGDWGADVVLIAMAHSGWGVPAHLRAILRGCARSGRGGRGAIIVCCTGRIDQNRDVHGDSTVLAADDFNAQPWVIPVAACGLRGGWYRVHRHPLGRLGPSVELCAPGELVTFPDVGAADDSSLAAALVAGTAARMLATHPELSLVEVRQLLRATALKLPSEEEPTAPGLEADRFNEWDGAGHNFKLGHGRVDAQGACLAAADPVCYALLATRRALSDQSDSPSTAGVELEAARGWESLLRNLAPRSDLAQRYLALRGYLVPLVLRTPALQDALFWLARHLRALRLYGPPVWPEDGTDHGALGDRCLHVLEVLGDSLEQAPAEVPVKEASRWLYELVRLLEAMPPQTVARFLAKACAFPTAAPG